MMSATATTYEIDDIEAAVQELSAEIKCKIKLAANSVGILFSQPDIDTRALTVGLNEKLGIDIIGGTTAGGATLTNAGHHELALTLHVLTADDCGFSAAISSALDPDPEAALESVYKSARETLDGEPGLIFCVSSIVPCISSDAIVSKLSDLSGEAPIFGFIAADDYEYYKQRVYLNGEVYGDRTAILLVSGNIRPLFCIDNLESAQNLTKRKVTKARGNIIAEIDGKPAYEYLKEFPFIVEGDSSSLWSYQFFVETKDDGVSVSRMLHNFDRESGEINCFGDIPENSYISLMYCDGEDVKRSCNSALDKIISKIDEAEKACDYRYTTMIVATCSLRIMYLAEEKEAEGAILGKALTPGLTASGVYAFGEIGPTSVYGAKARNRFHNATMTILAL